MVEYKGGVSFIKLDREAKNLLGIELLVQTFMFQTHALSSFHSQ